jgi:hypothetical protein
MVVSYVYSYFAGVNRLFPSHIWWVGYLQSLSVLLSGSASAPELHQIFL